MNFSGLKFLISRGILVALPLSLLRSFSEAQTLVPNPATPSATSENAAANAPDPAGEKRLQEVLKLKFDRSPASILAAQLKLDEGSFTPESVEQFQLRMIAGRWKGEDSFFATLPAYGRNMAFEATLRALDQTPVYPGPQQTGGPNRSPLLVPEDIADLSDFAPGPPTADQMKLLANLLKRAVAAGQSMEPLLARLDKGTKWLGGTVFAKRDRAGDLIIETGRARDALRIMPPLDPADETNSYPLLDKHAKLLAWRGRQEQRSEDLVESWRLSELILYSSECPGPIKDRALRRMADISRWLPSELVLPSFERICRSGPQVVMNLLRNVTLQVSDDRWQPDNIVRRLNLELQHRAVAALPAEEITEGVTSTLNQFALTWMDEAAYAKKVYVPPRQSSGIVYDRAGNLNASPPPEQPANPNQPKPVSSDDLIASAPDQNWRSRVAPAIKPRLLALEAELQLRTSNDARALPLIEELKPFDDQEALRLANEALRVWTTVRSQSRSLNAPPGGLLFPNQSPSGIPLTRALQRRNLDELGTMYQRFSALNLRLDRSLVVNAFSKAHSPAEVFRENAIEDVFGKISQIDLSLLSELLQAMSIRLAGEWRKPALQQQAKTQRTDVQIDAEVESGYNLLASLIAKALQRQPDNWRITLANATTQFDWAEFRYGRKVDLASYVKMRDEAFATFAHAADLYGAQLPSQNRKDDTATVYQQWLNAALGIRNLGEVARQQDSDALGLKRIHDSIMALPGDAARWHMAALIKAVNSSANSIPAHLKPIYLKAALSVMDDGPEAAKIRDAVAYHTGLIQELELDLRLDGESSVGHESPFGAFLTLHHTAEIERESAGGFAKYLRNDAQGNGFSYNGSSPIDHRDLLEKSIRERLADHFEIVSISFHDPKVQSYGYDRSGWRETPLAYLLLKAKDAAVDRLPSLQLDMDFNDPLGPVVLPVASGVQLLDAKSEAPSRPVTNVEVTEVLDERDLNKGRLSLEVKATALGLPPKFEELFDFEPGEFKVEEMNDSGPAVQRLSSDGPQLAAAVERTWLIKLNYVGKRGMASTAFKFPQARLAGAKAEYKRYQDVDLVEVRPEVALSGLPLGNHWLAPLAILGGFLIAVAGAALLFRRRRISKVADAPDGYRAPVTVTPFSTLQLLRRMYGDQELKLREPARTELSETIASVESFYFAVSSNASNGAPDLPRIVSEWLRRLKGRQDQRE